MNHEQHPNHAGNCIGHCRAQRQAMDYYCSEQYEKEKAAITSYEEGWDRWDGPIWPWRETNHPDAVDDHWQGCCNSPVEEVKPIDSTPKKAPRPNAVKRVSWSSDTSSASETSRPSSPPSHSLWSSHPCAVCGRTGSPSHL